MLSRRSWKSYIKPFTPPIAIDLYRRGKEILNIKSNHSELLTNKELTNLFPNIDKTLVSIPVSEMRRESGMLPLPELITLAAICQYAKPKTVFEIGTYRGASTLIMSMHTSEDAEIFTLDLPPEDKSTKYRVEIGDIAGKNFLVGERFRNTQFSSKIQQVYGDSALFDFKKFYKSIDLVFVDGSHSYENVKIDSQNAFNILRPGGVIIWDDYDILCGPEVMRALHEINNGALYQISGTRFAIYIDSV